MTAGAILPGPGDVEDTAPFKVLQQRAEQTGGNLPKGAIGVDGNDDDVESGLLCGVVVSMEAKQTAGQREEDCEEEGEKEDGEGRSHGGLGLGA